MHEVVRRYAAEQLQEAGETEQARHRHFAYYTAFVSRLDQRAGGPEEAAWFDLAEVKLDNIRAALAWSLSHPALAEQGLLAAGALPRFWIRRGFAREGLDWSVSLVRATEHFPPSLARAHALRTAGHLAVELGVYPTARGYYERALEVARAVGHKPNIAAIVRGLGALAHNTGDYATALECYGESMHICHELNDPFGEATSLGNFGLAALQNGDLAGAWRNLERCLAIRRELGDQIGIAYALHLLADTAWLMDRAGEAWKLNEEALSLRRRLGDKWGIPYSTDSMGVIAARQGRYPAAFELFQESLRRFDELGNRQGLLDTLGHFAAMLAAQDRWYETAVLLAGAATHRLGYRVPLPPHEQREFESLRAALSDHLDPERAGAAMLQGNTMSIQELAAYALAL